MEILDQIKNDLKKFQITKNELGIQTLRLVLSEIHNFEISQKAKKQEILTNDVISIIQKEIKKRKEAKDLFLKGNRLDLVDKTEQEIKLLLNYAPEQLGSEKIIEVINQLKSRGITDFNSLIKEIMEKYKGRIDGSEVRKIIEQNL